MKMMISRVGSVTSDAHVDGVDREVVEGKVDDQDCKSANTGERPIMEKFAIKMTDAIVNEMTNEMIECFLCLIPRFTLMPTNVSSRRNLPLPRTAAAALSQTR